MNANLRLFAFDPRVHLTLVLALLLRPRRDRDMPPPTLIRDQHDPHDTATVARKHRRRLHFAQELAGIDRGACLILGRDQLLVAGEGALNQLGGQFDIVELQQHLAARAVELQHDGVVLVGQEPAQLLQRPRRHDDLDRLRRQLRDVEVVNRQAEAVSARQDQPPLFDFELDPRKHRPTVVRRGSEDHVFQCLAQRLRL